MDGSTWQTVGTPVELDLPAEIFAGVAATSHNVTTKASFKFSDTRISREPRN
jgi:hypothetical protein